ncbi:MAG: glycosyltransferase family 4 protein [Cyanobacteria bacterium J06560_6]
MKVVHITPTYFDADSLIGGGERYPIELARSLANDVDTTLVSFSAERRSYRIGKLKIEIFPARRLIHGSHLNPLSFTYLNTIIKADVIHIHALNTVVSDLACITARALGKRVFVTDHGGGGSFVLNQKLPIFRLYTKAIAQSQFALEYLPEIFKEKGVVHKGGIDIEKFCPAPTLPKKKQVLYVGRILPHKGINYLIEGFRLLNRNDYQLRIIGRRYDQDFYHYLKDLADGLSVEFIHDANDQQVLREYRQAKVTVLPSVHTDYYGNYTSVPELMGFTLLESQACGTPVICTNAGAMHEFVEDGRTGFVVEQNSGKSIASALDQLLQLSSTMYEQYQNHCREWVQHLSWQTVIQKHFNIYRSSE